MVMPANNPHDFPSVVFITPLVIDLEASFSALGRLVERLLAV